MSQMRKNKPKFTNVPIRTPLRNAFWSMLNATVCMWCGGLHDSAGRQLDERGKIAEKQDCLSFSQKKEPPKKKNRMLDTEMERISNLP